MPDTPIGSNSPGTGLSVMILTLQRITWATVKLHNKEHSILN
jgi:hypothetical protein